MSAEGRNNVCETIKVIHYHTLTRVKDSEVHSTQGQPQDKFTANPAH